MVINGKKIAEEIFESLSEMPIPKGFFGVAIVGEDPASIKFVEQKRKAAERLGVDFRIYNLPSDISTDELRREVRRLSEPKTCAGFIVQLPLPAEVNKHYALNAIPKWKDPDLLSELALGAFYTGRHIITPPAVEVVEEILKRHVTENKEEFKDWLRRKKAVVVGAGFLIGKPIGFWMQNRVGELLIFDEHIKNISERLSDADIVISGTGAGHLFGPEDLKKDTIVIDFSWAEKNGKIVGDFDHSSINESKNASVAFTPTPQGTGPILVAKLFENFYKLANRD